MENSVKKSTDYTLSETAYMIGKLAQTIHPFRHLEGTAVYESLKKQIEKARERIDNEIDRREAEAEKAYFKAHPELNP